MSTMTLAYIAILVFFLMLVGLFLSAREFLRVSDDPSKLEGTKSKDKGSR